MVFIREICPTCKGSGKDLKNQCESCNGSGEFDVGVDQYYHAYQYLKSFGLIDVDESVKELVKSKINQLTPDNYLEVLKPFQQKYSNKDFRKLHDDGAAKWEWLWMNANRFLVELATLNGVDCFKYRYELTKLVESWLMNDPMTISTESL